jgi:hypothetical protein
VTSPVRDPMAASLPGHPGFPSGERSAGRPHGRGLHAGHDVASLTSGRREGGPVGRRVCLTCELVLGPMALCGRPTKRGFLCRVAVRTDLGHTTCWSHGAGRGRASTPARRATA